MDLYARRYSILERRIVHRTRRCNYNKCNYNAKRNFDRSRLLRTKWSIEDDLEKTDLLRCSNPIFSVVSAIDEQPDGAGNAQTNSQRYANMCEKIYIVMPDLLKCVSASGLLSVLPVPINPFTSKLYLEQKPCLIILHQSLPSGQKRRASCQSNLLVFMALTRFLFTQSAFR